MREATARAWTPQLVEHPLPGRAASQLRLALDLLPAGDAPPLEPIPLHAHAPLVRAGLQPRLAWPARPTPARGPGGVAIERRTDFYDWILLRRRRAQMAARRALGDV